MKIPKKNIIPLEMSDADMKRFWEMIQKGDPRCRFQPGDRVYKARSIEENELTPIGTKGTVIGAMYIDDTTAIDKDAYWIFWDGNPMAITSVGRRLEKLDEPPQKLKPGLMPFKIK